MMLITFSYAYLPSMNSGSVCSRFLPFILLYYWIFILKFWNLIHFRYSSFIRYKLWSDFSLSLWLVFSFSKYCILRSRSYSFRWCPKYLDFCLFICLYYGPCFFCWGLTCAQPKVTNICSCFLLESL